MSPSAFNYGSNSFVMPQGAQEVQSSTGKHVALRKFLDEMKVQQRDTFGPTNEEVPARAIVLDECVNLDIQQLQQRIMGLEKKIKNGNDAMKEAHNGRNQALREMIKRSFSRDKENFSFNQATGKDESRSSPLRVRAPK